MSDQDYIQKLIGLPFVVYFEGIEFQLAGFVHYGEIRICYAINDVWVKSPHYKTYQQKGGWQNPFLPGAYRDFLYLQEGITNEIEFSKAIDDCILWLTQNGFK